MKTFNEVIIDQTKTATKIPQSDYLENGKYRIFDQGKEYSTGYSNEETGLVKDFPYIIFGDHTRVVKFINEPCFIGADGVKLLKVFNKNFDTKYIYYNILAKPIESQGYARHFKFLKEIKFTEKSLSEQQKIAEVLDTIQSAIDKKKQQLACLEELVKSKFVEMFGDPISNPKTKEKKYLNELGKLNSGGTPTRTKPENFKGNINWYSAGELNELYLPESIEKITQDALEKSSAKLFKKGSLLIGMYDTAALKRGILQFDAASNQACACIEPNISLLNVIYLYYTLELMKDFFLQQRKGARQKNLNLGMIKNFEIPYFPISLQNTFATFVQKADNAKELIKAQLKDLSELLESRMDFYFGE